MPERRPARRLPWIAALVAGCLAVSSAFAQLAARRGGEDPNHPCGIIYTQHVGPFDYRTQRDELKIVEDFHFTPKVEMLMAGQSGFIGGDIDYTLKASPNHHRALLALMRWTERQRSDKTTGQQFNAECYFDRAIRFKPDDTVVRALYAQFLHKRKRTADAMTQLQAGVEHAGENAFSHYNLGLVYLELGAHDRALTQAHKAASLGFPRTELKQQLVKLGKWQDPPAN